MSPVDFHAIRKQVQARSLWKSVRLGWNFLYHHLYASSPSNSSDELEQHLCFSVVPTNQQKLFYKGPYTGPHRGYDRSRQQQVHMMYRTGRHYFLGQTGDGDSPPGDYWSGRRWNQSQEIYVACPAAARDSRHGARKEHLWQYTIAVVQSIMCNACSDGYKTDAGISSIMMRQCIGWVGILVRLLLMYYVSLWLLEIIEIATYGHCHHYYLLEENLWEPGRFTVSPWEGCE